jgi:MoaA/NifB/PqqE/SkfB family radical SAM enzyme
VPNLVITNACNLSCPFCFASEYRCAPESAARMTMQEFRSQVAFAGGDTVRFCGGEPTLHPDFNAMLDLALAEPARRAMIMTNGVWADGVRDHIATLPRAHSDRITFLFNVLSPDTYAPGQRQRLLDTLGRVDRSRVTLGVTIYRVPFDYGFVVELAKQFGFTTLRYSVAAPNITDPATWHLDPEWDFRALAETVYRLVTDGRALGLRVQSDCGYIPPCQFTSDQLAALQSDDAIEFRCHGPVDIGPGGEAWRCYGLYADQRVHVSGYPDSTMLVGDFEARTLELENRFLFDTCEDCDFRARGECGGGCYAFRVARSLRDRALTASVGLDDDSLMSAVPRIDDEVLKWFEHGGRAKWMVLEDDTWARLRTTDLEERVLAHCDGTRDVRAIADAVDPSRANDVARAIRRFFERGALELSSPGRG